MTELPLKRVVITGMGAITPLGNNLADYWTGLINGKSGIGLITHFDASRHACRIAGEVRGFDPHEYVDRKEAKRMDRFAQFAVAASLQALQDSRLVIDALNADDIGVLIGTGVGGIKVLEDQQEIYLTKGPGRCSPFMIPMMIANMAAGLTAIHTGAKGPSNCTVTACAAGSNAIGDAFRLVQRGLAKGMICGGTEAAVTPLGLAGFASAKALSTRNATRAIELAIKDAGLTPAEISYINAHGTSTGANDPTETKAIKKALGESAYQIPVSSTKSMTGHLLGGSGGIEAVATVMAIANDRIPPTLNLDNPDPDCDLDYVPYESRQQIVNAALSNSFGFGGHNVTLAFRKYA